MGQGRPPFSARPTALHGAERRRLKGTIAEIRRNLAFGVVDKIWPSSIEKELSMSKGYFYCASLKKAPTRSFFSTFTHSHTVTLEGL